MQRPSEGDNDMPGFEMGVDGPGGPPAEPSSQQGWPSNRPVQQGDNCRCQWSRGPPHTLFEDSFPRCLPLALPSVTTSGYLPPPVYPPVRPTRSKYSYPSPWLTLLLHKVWLWKSQEEPRGVSLLSLPLCVCWVAERGDSQIPGLTLCG